MTYDIKLWLAKIDPISKAWCRNTSVASQCNLRRRSLHCGKREHSCGHGRMYRGSRGFVRCTLFPPPVRLPFLQIYKITSLTFSHNQYNINVTPSRLLFTPTTNNFWYQEWISNLEEGNYPIITWIKPSQWCKSFSHYKCI